ncbi:MAG: DUF1134 domain-containing protein [Acetobacteraceae bacterium]|nr:DUF1134 domain-containing protein [Acetobacteraceae bacterium]MBV8525653.1 DUF1134 domain-containing protein [Acetobacteraceae bacterium]MBV8588918.1 DUF1134 domain-containing protein [Acetobacteraceae bacterium]
MTRRTAALFPLVLAATALMWAVPSSGRAQTSAPPRSSSPDGTVTLSGGSVAAGIGFSWGNGTLVYKGRQHQFTVRGLSVINVGATGYTATGVVYNLPKLEDFNGNYVAASAGATVAGGGSVSYMRNQYGVVIELDSTTQGLGLNLSGSGVSITLTD